jgi:hypothetical protein
MRRKRFRLRVRLAGFVAVLAVGASCSSCETQSDLPSVSAKPPASNLVEAIPATQQRPYSFRLPEGWWVEDTVHADGSSRVIASGEHPGAVGYVYGVVEPSGQIVKYNPPPSDKVMRLSGGEASEPEAITVSGRPAWQMLVTWESPQPFISSLLVGVDVGQGAGFQLIFSWRSDEFSVDLFAEVVASVEIDDALLNTVLTRT